MQYIKLIKDNNFCKNTFYKVALKTVLKNPFKE